MGPDQEIRRFVRAAFQRLEAADLLFRHERYLDAIYLAGYGPECAMKALVLSRLPVKNRLAFVKEHFRSRKAHNYDYLKALLHRHRVPPPVVIVRHLENVNYWTTDLRYEVRFGDERATASFLRSAREIVNWVNRSL